MFSCFHLLIFLMFEGLFSWREEDSSTRKIIEGRWIILAPYCSVFDLHLACSRLRDSGEKSFSVKRNAKNARGLGRDRESEPVRIFLTACSGIPAPDIPSDWSIVTVNISPIFLAATAPFPKSCASYFRFARFNRSALYYLRVTCKGLYLSLALGSS